MQTSTVDTQLTVDTLVAATVDTQTSTVDTQLTVDTLDAVTVDTQISTVDTQLTVDTVLDAVTVGDFIFRLDLSFTLKF